MTRFCRIVGAVLVCACAIGCGRGDTAVAAQCKRIRDHLVDLELPAGSRDRDLRAGVMVRALGDEFLASCARSMTETQRDCALSASDSKSALDCNARSNR